MGEKARVLVVDDNEAGRYALGRCLSEAGFEVLEAASGHQCLQLAAQHPVDLILLDIKLPDINGIEVCRRLKSDSATSEIPVIQISALFTASHDRVAGLESGADAYLASPFNPRELLAHVKALVRMRTTESALRVSEARFRALFEQNAGAFFSVDERGRFIMVNAACEGLSGYSRDELMRMHFLEICAPDQRDATLRSFQRAFTEHAGQKVETALIRKDGQRVELLITGSPFISTSRKAELYCNATDITDQKRTEEALRHNEERLRLLADNLPQSAVYQYIQEPDGSRRFLYYSIGLERLNGITLAELQRDPALLHRQVLPEYQDALLAEEARSAQQLSDFDLEVPLRRRDGQLRWMHLHSRPRRLEGGRTIWDGVQTDITDRKAAEREREATVKFLRLINSSSGLKQLIAAAADFFVAECGCESVGVRIKEGEDYPYQETRGFTDFSHAKRVSTFALGSEAEVNPGLGANPLPTCMCGRVISGNVDLSKPFFTPSGSFWTNSSSELLATCEEADRRSMNLKLCHLEGCESVAFIPLRAGGENFGLLQLNDKRQGRLSACVVGLCESLAGYLAVAIGKLRAEEALRRAHDTFRHLVQRSPFGVFVVDSDFRLTEVSVGARELFKNVNPLAGRDFAEVMRSVWPEPIATEAIDRFRQTLETGKPHRAAEDIQSRRDTGQAGSYDWRTERISLPDGGFGVVCHFYDLSERQRFETELQGHRELLETVVNNIPASVCLMRGSDLRLQLVNPPYQAIAPGKVMVGKTLDELWPEAGQNFSAICRQVVETGQSYTVDDEFNMIRRRPDGPLEPAFFSWSLHRVRLPGEEGWGVLNTAWETTARRRAELALQESEQRLRLAKTAAQIGIHDYNPLTGELHWDDRLRALWGLGQNDPVSYDVFIAGIHPEDRPAVDAAVQQALNPSGKGYFYSEYRVVRDGQTRWVSATGQTTFADGKAVRFIGTVQDITERREFQAELERLVTERTAKLYELVAELEHLSYSITHDMRAPLRAMRGFAEVVRDLCASRPEPQLQTFLDRIISAAERMDILITDALNYTKTVRQEFPIAPIDLHRLLQGMLDTYPEFLNHLASIRVEGRLPIVLGNEAALTQCFSNLIGNALKFVEPGAIPDVRIYAEPIGARQPAISGGSSRTDGTWVRLWVEDKGIGIHPAMVPRVFDMFARGTGSYQGTGIGLALVRKVVQRMGGRVGVESELGKGSRFWVELKVSSSVP